MWKAAFMGWQPDDKKHKLGHKFANVVCQNDMLLIARRFRGHAEIVGFGVVRDTYKTNLKGFNPPQKFGSLRKLKPFKALSAAPSDIPIMDALGQTAALRQLHPESNSRHKRICEWLERALAEKAGAGKRGVSKPQTTRTDITKLPLTNELEYQLKTQRKIMLARRREAELVDRYRELLEDQHRKLVILKFGNLRCDAYEEKRQNLIEAKCSSEREYVRMAVGQLLDYKYLGGKRLRKCNMAILLPRRPDRKLIEWLSELNIGVVWREKNVFLDKPMGQFT